jgi:uncharacterized repeat protein (TIGR04052 family)
LPRKCGGVTSISICRFCRGRFWQGSWCGGASRDRLDEKGKPTPVELTQDDKWQFDDLALIDFEDATGACGNGTPETNTVVSGTVPAGRYSGIQFTVGVPFEKNHTDLTTMPSPLNLTALAWVWNAGRKFMRVEVASTGKPRGFVLHLGSTGCTPNQTRITVPTTCAHPNRVEVSLGGFDLALPSRL